MAQKAHPALPPNCAVLPYVGNRVGLYAELTGYEGLNVAVQWQRWDPTTETWEDIPGATNLALWIDTTVGMDGSMWQVVVTIL